MADDYAGDTTTKGTVSIGGSTSGVIETSGDTDWFRITLTAGQNYDFRLDAAAVGGLSDPFLELRDSSGTFVVSNDDGGGNLNSLITFTAATSGTYYLDSHDFSTGTGNYVVSAVPDDYAGNISTKGTVSIGGSTTGVIETSEDTDWFRITLAAGQNYEFRLDAAAVGGLSNPFLELRDSSGTFLASDDDTGGNLNSLITFTAATSDTYYLDAHDFSAGTGNYIVSAVLDDYAGTTSTEGTVSIGGSTAGVIETSGDTDWFRITLAAGVTYEFRLDSANVNGLSDPFLELRDSGGTFITSDNDGDGNFNSLITFTASVSGTYYLDAHDVSTGTGNYVVRTDVISGETFTSTTSGIALTGTPQNPATIATDATITNTLGDFQGDAVYGNTVADWQITNFGTVNATGTASSGMHLKAGGDVTNDGDIAGVVHGILIDGAFSFVGNFGTVAATSTDSNGVDLEAGGQVINGFGKTVVGVIAGVANGIFVGGESGFVTNYGSGQISGVAHGIFLTGGSGFVDNYGTMAATATLSSGMELAAGGNVTNFKGGLAAGAMAGIYVTGGAGYVHNSGSITGIGKGNGVGVKLSGGGLVANGTGGSSSGYISGAAVGVLIGGGNGTITNSGMIIGGSGVVVGSGVTTVTNSATVVGTAGTAVSLGGGTNRLILAPGALLQGAVDGGGGKSVLEVAASAGVLAGATVDTAAAAGQVTLGSVHNFSGLQVDTGVAAYAGGNLAFNALVNQGQINLGAGYSLVVASIGGGTATNSGTIIGGSGVIIAAGKTGTVVNSGTIIAGTAGTAVSLGGGSNRLILASGSLVQGKADGGGGGSVVELAASIGGLAAADDTAAATAYVNLGSVTNFSALQVDPGAATDADGNLTFDTLVNEGQINLLFGDSLVVGTVAGAATGGTIDLKSGGSVHFTGAVAAGQTVLFRPPGGSVAIDHPEQFAAAITQFAATDLIDLPLGTASFQQYAGGVLSLNYGGATVALQLSTTAVTPQFQFTPDGQGGTDISVSDACFCRGTLILAERGEVAVEDLAVGERVRTLLGAAKPILWIGTGSAPLGRGNRLARPVIVRRGALAEGVPSRDLYLTHGHALYLEGVLIPVENLVNHHSILWDESALRVEYYHIELADHDVLLANGAPAESYYDANNRAQFDNVRPGSAPGEAIPGFAPLLGGGEIVELVWAALLARAGGRPAGETTDDPDLHLMVNGARLDPPVIDGTAYRFTLPAPPAGPLALRSRSGVPSLLGITAHDHRRLGVAISRIVYGQRGVTTTLLHNVPVLQQGGCHPPEAAFCWTDGELELPARLFAHMRGPFTLTVHTERPGGMRYPLAGKGWQAA